MTNDQHTAPTDRTLPAAPGSRRARRARVAAATGVTAGGLLLASLLAGGLLTACGSDGDASTGTTVAGATAPAGTVEVTATDYAFSQLPDEVAAGSRLHLTNDSNVEIHELVAIRLADGDERPVEEVLHDPALEATAPATVLVTPPGADQIAAVGDGTLTQPGRYVLICTIPTGVSPQVFLDAAAAAGGGKPVIPDAGEPHLAHGMYAELVVS